jgi:hypothetical protein
LELLQREAFFVPFSRQAHAGENWFGKVCLFYATGIFGVNIVFSLIFLFVKDPHFSSFFRKRKKKNGSQKEERKTVGRHLPAEK